MSESYGKLHVFAGTFKSREDACLYTQEQWEPEPGDEATDEEYSSWENRNPTWSLKNDLRVGLRSDFLETIDGDTRYDYLRGYLVTPSDIDVVRATAGDANILVLIFPESLHDSSSQLASTSKMKYCGSFDFRWP